MSWDCLREEGVSRLGGQGSNVHVLCAEPKEHKHFRPGTRPGSVTGVTEKSFMGQIFIGLFWPQIVVVVIEEEEERRDDDDDNVVVDCDCYPYHSHPQSKSHAVHLFACVHTSELDIS